MSTVSSGFDASTPIDLVVPPDQPVDFQSETPTYTELVEADPHIHKKCASYVQSWKTTLRNNRQAQFNLWNECWMLYRGLEDFSDKEEWQSKIVLPKAYASVKAAVGNIKKFLQSSERPWLIEPHDADNTIASMAAERMSQLTSVFLNKAGYIDEFAEGLECGFIIGIGVWKLWWGLESRLTTNFATGPDGMPVVSPTELQEGRLFIKAVDPYHFYWLPGSKPNSWVGTLEEIEVPIWQLRKMLDAMSASGVAVNPEVFNHLTPSRIDSYEKQARLRHNETVGTTSSAPFAEADVVKVTDYYGPVIIDNKLIYEHGHIILVNDICAIVDENRFWRQRPPYVAFSPLSLPFRTEGVGIVELNRELLRSMNAIANLSMDTLKFRLLPVFEVYPDVYENPEDFETGLNPGKIFRRRGGMNPVTGIVPVQFQDISGGAVQVAAQLDRSFQEGSMISEIQQAVPRFRGYQSAAEIEIKNANQQGFLSSMAADIERKAIQPIVEMAMDLIVQFLNTSADPRVINILGVDDAQMLAGLRQSDIVGLVSGDYIVKVSGISSEISKMEELQNLVQLMNIIGQNPTYWLPFVNQSELLKRVLHAFHPAIRDIDKIIASPDMIDAQRAQMQMLAIAPNLVDLMPQIIQLAQQAQQTQGGQNASQGNG